MKIYMGETIHPEAVALLEKKAEIIRPKDNSRPAFLEALKEVDGIIARKIEVRAEEMDHAPRCKVIARHGAGLDTVDIDQATKRGILVTYTPGANKESVAELALTFMLSLARRIPQAQAAIRSIPKDSGQFYAHVKRFNLTGNELEGKSLGIIGTGRIGSAVARKCVAAFDMKVKGYDPYVSGAAMKSFGVEKAERLEDMLPVIDFLTIHCPLTDETKGMVGKKELALMKKGAYVVHTARGGIIDEKALYGALSSGPIAGAAIDVWEMEPPDPADPLLNQPQVIGTPHIAGTTEEALYRCGIAVVEEVLTAAQGKMPRWPVNPEAWKRR